MHIALRREGRGNQFLDGKLNVAPVFEDGLRHGPGGLGWSLKMHTQFDWRRLIDRPIALIVTGLGNIGRRDRRRANDAGQQQHN